MGNDIIMLITLSNGENLLRVALKCGPETLSLDDANFWGEPENKEKIFDLLPAHVQSFGKIVECERLFEITII